MKLLYLMHIDWNWIMQRPQYIALGLSDRFEVDVIQMKRLTSKRLKRSKHVNETDKLNSIRSIFLFPKYYRFSILKLINRFIFKILINCNKYDSIWIPYPEYIEYIPKNYNGSIIYDCMDDYTALAPASCSSSLQLSEISLIEKASIIYVSSKVLYNKLIKLGADAIKLHILRNGYQIDEKSLVNYRISEPLKKENYSIAYYGTIASWFDIDSLLYVDSMYDKVSFVAFGPIEKGVDICGIEYGGVLEHSELSSDASKRDCLIMPFIVCEAIEAVDPVKLYEYISFGRCIISCWYEEIQRFEPFVYFYKDKKELCNLIGKLSAAGFPPKYSLKEGKVFLKHSSWSSRLESVYNQLQSF